MCLKSYNGGTSPLAILESCIDLSYELLINHDIVLAWYSEHEALKSPTFPNLLMPGEADKVPPCQGCVRLDIP